jgi:Dyp-type peroxidase family
MDQEVRAESLGDRDANAPTQWQWGRTHDDKVHVLLMLYGKHDTEIDEFLKTHDLAGAFHVVLAKETTHLKDNKEHFGWRDGLSMPIFEGVPPAPADRSHKAVPPSWTGPLKPGEFVLGYANEYGCLSESPTVEADDDPANHLPALADDPTHKDLGRNGTYLVYREMTQDVHGLWDYLGKSREPGADPAARAIALGAKMVGRWPSGAPLITSKASDNPKHAEDNAFRYADDPVGLACPLGAHIRRANPRDVLSVDRGVDDSLEMVRKHQMIRRGRPFGPAVATSMEPRAILAAPEDTVERGLHFICLVGHISRQFEFVQRAWIHSANFAGLFKDGDPISAARRLGDENPNDEFTCPATPLRRKYTQMPQFTKLVGGAYFFLPGIRALRFIARD